MSTINHNLKKMKYYYPILIIFFIFLLSFEIKAQDSRWKYLTKSEEFVLYYDTNTVIEDSQIFSVWTETIPIKEYYDNNGEVVKSILTHWDIYCNSNKVREYDVTYYYRKDKYKNKDYDEIKSVKPQTFAEKLYSQFCKHCCADSLQYLLKYVENNPNANDLCKIYYQIAGIYCDKNKDFKTAIKYFETVSNYYPETDEAKNSLFLIAFIYDDMLKEKQKAIEAYKYFLLLYPYDKNPNEHMSETAKKMLEMLENE